MAAVHSNGGGGALTKELWLQTSFGKLRVLSIGKNDSEYNEKEGKESNLVLVVHGSGSASSAEDFAQVEQASPANVTHVHVLQVAFGACLRSPLPLFFALLDCPGYGKSEDRPVCGDLKRLEKLAQPTLLAFDSQDPGHPISMGRRMAKYIRKCRFLEWNHVTQLDWYFDNFVTEMLQFLLDGRPPPKGQAVTSAGRKSPTRPPARAADAASAFEGPGGSAPVAVSSSPERQAAPLKAPPPICGLCDSEPAALACFDCPDLVRRTRGIFLCSSSSSSTAPSEGSCDADCHSGIDEPHRRVPLRGLASLPVFPPLSEAKRAETATTTDKSRRDEKVRDTAFPLSEAELQERKADGPRRLPRDDSEMDASDLGERQEATWGAAASNEGASVAGGQELKEEDEAGAEEDDTPLDFACALCLSLLWQPVRTPCAHTYCLRCLKEAILYKPSCPMCRQSLQGFSPTEKSVDRKLVEEMLSSLPAKRLAEREQQAEDELKRQASVVRIQIRYGNRSEALPTTGSKPRYKWTMFVRIAKTRQLTAYRLSRLLAGVTFDINPGSKNGAVHVSRQPWELERSGTYEFDYVVVLHWQPVAQEGANARTRAAYIGASGDC